LELVALVEGLHAVNRLFGARDSALRAGHGVTPTAKGRSADAFDRLTPLGRRRASGAGGAANRARLMAVLVLAGDPLEAARLAIKG
jgi:hypothetical protein